MALTGSELCVFFTYLQVLSALIAHAFFSLGPRVQAAPKDEVELFGNVPLMLLPFLIPALVFNLFEQFVRTRKDSRALTTSRLIIVELGLSIAMYTFMHSQGGGVVYQNLRSHGAPRPVYVARYVGWALGALNSTIVLTNLPLLDGYTFTEAMKRLAPMCLASAAYCWACCLGMIVQSPAMGWWLCVLGLVSYLATAVDQIELVLQHWNTRMLGVKVFPVAAKETVFASYAIVYMLAFRGETSSYTTESAFCFFDLTSKAVAALFVFLFWAALPAQGSAGKARQQQQQQQQQQKQQNLPNLLQAAARRAGDVADVAKATKEQ